MSGSSFQLADVGDPQGLTHAAAPWLSLALMDARNRTLRWLTAFEQLRFDAALDDFDPPAWLAGQAAWFQEYWVARNLQRNRGAAADARGPRLASIEPQADDWFAPASGPARRRWSGVGSYRDSLRAYLAATLEATLELLDKADASDEGLYFFRLSLLHEDRIAETLACLARAVDLPLGDDDPLAPVLPSRIRRDPIGIPAQQVSLGTPGAGFVPDNERPLQQVEVPEFEIDAQPVCWAQFVEFATDGGYDERRWWSPEGWDWVEASGRRAPRYVEQLAGGVVLHSRGRIQRAPAGQSVLHVNAYEADAWCRWAGRRLPAEPEWALAVAQAQARGFAWGDGFEWVAGTARAWPGQRNGPACLDAAPAEPGWRTLRGASVATGARLRRPGGRRYAQAGRDDIFCGFRSCAL